MQLKQFKVSKFRNVVDSGWIDIDQITAFVGQNEAGKSNLFEALYRLHPFEKDAEYDINEDWPADDWDGRDEDHFVCEAKFEITDQDDLEDLYSTAAEDGDEEEQEDKENEENQADDSEDVDEDWEPVSFTYKRKYSGQDSVYFTPLPEELNLKKAKAWVRSKLPHFVYIAEYELTGTQVELNNLAQREKQHGWSGLTNEEQTILIILQLAKIDLEDFIEKGSTQEGRTLRSFDKRQASAYLTKQFARLWRQKKVRFDIDVDGNTLNIFVEDEGLGMPVRLARRSTGFRWHVSFAWKFTHASQGDYEDCIILLEEPGVHLHYDAHRDLLQLFEELSKDNTILYTTHLATMLDQGNPERLRIVEVHNHHAKVRKGVVSNQRAPMMIVEACLGLTGDMSGLLGNRQTLIVEGGSDALILHKLSSVLQKSGREGLSDRIYLWPADSASKTPMHAGLLVGHKWDSGVLLDTDDAGHKAATKIKELYLKNLAGDAKFRIFMLGKTAGVKNTDVAIEDLFPEKFYIDCVNSAYGYTISTSDLPVDGSTLITKRVEAVLKEKYHRDELDKGLVMNEMLKRFNEWDKAEDLPRNTANRAEKMFKTINKEFAEDK